MTRFVDGPAVGKVLSLHRGPFFLRVVVNSNNEWDGLDQLDYVPQLDETLYAYEVHENHGTVHIHAAKGHGGFYPMLSYRICAEQPDDATMRDYSKWVAWCEAQADKRGLKVQR